MYDHYPFGSLPSLQIQCIMIEVANLISNVKLCFGLIEFSTVRRSSNQLISMNFKIQYALTKSVAQNRKIRSK